MIDLIKTEENLYETVPLMKNFVQKIPEEYLNLFEKRIMERVLKLINEETFCQEDIDNYIRVLKFCHNCEIITQFNMKVVKIKLEKNNKLTPKMYSFFLKTNANNSEYNI
jgi:hypothetical protein